MDANVFKKFGERIVEKLSKMTRVDIKRSRIFCNSTSSYVYLFLSNCNVWYKINIHQNGYDISANLDGSQIDFLPCYFPEGKDLFGDVIDPDLETIVSEEIKRYITMFS